MAHHPLARDTSEGSSPNRLIELHAFIWSLPRPMCTSVQFPCSSHDSPEYVRGYHLMPTHHAVSSVLQRRLKIARL